MGCRLIFWFWLDVFESKRYTAMHYFGIPRLSQSMIAYYIFGYYISLFWFWEFLGTLVQNRIVHVFQKYAFHSSNTFWVNFQNFFAHNRFAVFKSRKKFMMISFLTTQDLQDFVHINIIFYLADNSCEIGCFSQRTRKN